VFYAGRPRECLGMATHQVVLDLGMEAIS